MTPSTYRETIAQIKSVPQELQRYVVEFVHALTGHTPQKGPDNQNSVKSICHNGTIEVPEGYGQRDGQSVIVTFLEEEKQEEDIADEAFWTELDSIIQDCQISTGIEDLAANHDHYIHGTPKQYN